jgi:hypothetical protein
MDNLSILLKGEILCGLNQLLLKCVLVLRLQCMFAIDKSELERLIESQGDCV